jgi:hypothetical protein
MKTEPQPSDREVLAGLVERVTYQNAENGFCVIRVKARGHRDLVTVVGHAAAITAGEWITASRDWTNDRTHGQQFKARFLKTSAPTSIEGIEKYLASGMIRGIGPVYAKKLLRALGEKVFDVIETEPDRLREVDGIGPVRANRIAAARSLSCRSSPGCLASVLDQPQQGQRLERRFWRPDGFSVTETAPSPSTTFHSRINHDRLAHLAAKANSPDSIWPELASKITRLRSDTMRFRNSIGAVVFLTVQSMAIHGIWAFDDAQYPDLGDSGKDPLLPLPSVAKGRLTRTSRRDINECAAQVAGTFNVGVVTG